MCSVRQSPSCERRQLTAEPCIIDRAPLANAGDDILKHPALGRVIEHVVRRHGQHASGARQFLETMEPKRIIGPEPSCERTIRPIAELALQPTHSDGERVINAAGNEDPNLARAPFDNIVPREPAGALARPTLACREESAEAAIGGTIGRIDEKRRPVLKVQSAPDEEANTSDLRSLVRSHDPGERVAVDHAEGGDAEHRGLRE
jgi:hypothetical protein